MSPGFRPISDPHADQHDCRLAVLDIGQRIAAGEPATALHVKADAWLDLYAVLERRDALRGLDWDAS